MDVVVHLDFQNTREYREIIDALEMMSDAQLLRRYRLDGSRIRDLCTLIEDDLPPSATERGRPIPTSVQVCATLYNLA